MSHTAYSLETVVTPGFKPTALDSWGHRLVVGGSDGSVHIYESDDDSRRHFHEVNSSKDVSRKSIEQLCVAECEPGVYILITLSESVIKIHTLPRLQHKLTMEKTRGCYLFACNKNEIGEDRHNAGPLNLCVAHKKKFMTVFRWQRERQAFSNTTELVVPDTVRTLEWAGASLCVGFKKEYNLIHVATGAMKDIFPVGRNKTPVACLLPNREILLGKDYHGICVGFDGKPTRKEGVVWSDLPVAITHSHPYVVALLPNGVEVRNLATRTLTQTLPVRSAKSVTKRGESVTYCASDKGVYALMPVPLYKQVNELAKQALFKEALSLVETSNDSQWREPGERAKRVKDINTLYSYHLFNKGDYVGAMRFFQQTDRTPQQILSLFPDVLPSSEEFSKVKHPVRLNRIVGEDNLLKALSSLIPYLAHLKSRILMDHDDEGDKAKQQQQGSSDSSSSSGGGMDLKTLVDTVLLKAYLLTDGSLVMPFLQSPNHCDIEESQNILRAYEKYGELVCLYKSHGHHRQALELLAQLGQSSNSLNPLHGTMPTVEYLRDLAADPQTKENVALILEFSRWVLKSNPEEGLSIFTHVHTNQPRRQSQHHGHQQQQGLGAGGASSSAPDAIPPSMALDHLKATSDVDICVAYLESLISTGETRAQFHNELIFLYLDEVTEHLARLPPTQGASRGRVVAGNEPGRLGILRKKLLGLLRSSVHYNPEKLLSKFPRDQLLEERAVLLSRINQHQQALSIYAHRLQDPRMAEEYCAQNYNESGEEERHMYLHLLRVLLRPDEHAVEGGGERPAPMVDVALDIMSRHYERLDGAAALDLIPGDTDLHKLMPFFEAVLSGNRHDMRNDKVVKHLLRAEHLHARSECLEASRHRIYIDDETVCGYCRKRMGNSAFVRHPGGELVHYICYTQAEKRRQEASS